MQLERPRNTRTRAIRGTRSRFIIAALAAVCGLLTGCGSPSAPVEITKAELASEMKSGKPPVLLDVREAEERKVSTIAGSQHIPLGELPDKLDTLDRSAHIVVFCRSGRRSAQAVALMRDKGFTKVRSLSGGMLEWERK